MVKLSFFTEIEPLREDRSLLQGTTISQRTLGITEGTSTREDLQHRDSLPRQTWEDPQHRDCRTRSHTSTQHKKVRATQRRINLGIDLENQIDNVAISVISAGGTDILRGSVILDPS